MLYLASGQFELAEEQFEKAVERMPRNLVLRNNLAVAQLRMGAYEEAERNLRWLMEADPSDPDAYFNLAVLEVAREQFDSAVVLIQKGAEYCTPIELRRYVSDPDFKPLWDYPLFQSIMRMIYGDLPELR